MMLFVRSRFVVHFAALAFATFGVGLLQGELIKPVVPTPPAEPQIPAFRVVLTEFGAVGDGRFLNTEAFARAIAAVAERGGGTLVVPAGIWHTGPIELRSRLRLHLEPGALIQFSRDHTLYPMRLQKARGERFVATTSPVFGEHIEDVAITGTGVIDGGGDAWRLVKRAKVTDNFWKQRIKSGGVLNAKGDEWWPSADARDGAAAIEKLRRADVWDLAAYEPYRVSLRPKLLRLVDCRRVLIEGVTFRNAPNWTLHPWLCEDVTLRDLKIFNDRWAQNSDAVDIESCRRVLVRGCIVDTGDDGLCIKSGINEVGRRIGVPTEDVLIEDCVVYEGHGGFTIGSEMSGGVRNVLVQNCTFIGTALGLRFKTVRGRGGVVENIHMRGIRMIGIEGNAIDFNFSYFLKGADTTVVPVDEGTPQFRNMLFEDIVSTDAAGTIEMRGLPESPIRAVTFRSVSLSARRGAVIAFADGITFDQVRIVPAQGEPVRINSVTSSQLDLAR